MPDMPLKGTSSRAIALMIGAIFMFSIMDMTAKALSREVGVTMTIWARYTGQTVLVLLLVANRIPQILRTRYPQLQFARSLFLLLATAFYFVGISNIGLTQAAAVMNVNPVLITLGAAAFLGETLGIRRLIGIAVALFGALIVIRPGGDVFSIYSIFPLGAALCYSVYALATRFVGRDEDVRTSLVYTGLVGAGILTVVVIPVWQTPTAYALMLMLVVAGAGTLGQLCLIRALSLGEAGMLAPFAYSGLIFATFWGYWFFDELPDVYSIIGACMIAGAGIYVWYREMSVKQGPPLD
ncbi:DMT family transporter [Shimia abyssi]|uniref:Putative membrane protein n=1 Tax=Shimia abyssi TaxID=1662395 RepID=A0A2P8FIY7_9RHOB|nr:DMT family transporter [Shimia abyssi]PSL21663.1 putative membrane protein [Shimia abyssi]